jgi:hypothetical protein
LKVPKSVTSSATISVKETLQLSGTFCDKTVAAHDSMVEQVKTSIKSLLIERASLPTIT